MFIVAQPQAVGGLRVWFLEQICYDSLLTVNDHVRPTIEILIIICLQFSVSSQVYLNSSTVSAEF